MCAVIDTNIAHEVFGRNPTEAGVKFFDRLNSGKMMLLVGGQLRKELFRIGHTKQWIQQALISGKAKLITKGIEELTKQLSEGGMCKSDDPHIIALAQISGARLLYSNDINLHKDFRDKTLIDQPRGRIYSTLKNKDFSTTHKKLLTRTDLCQTKP